MDRRSIQRGVRRMDLLAKKRVTINLFLKGTLGTIKKFLPSSHPTFEVSILELEFSLSL